MHILPFSLRRRFSTWLSRSKRQSLPLSTPESAARVVSEDEQLVGDLEVGEELSQRPKEELGLSAASTSVLGCNHLLAARFAAPLNAGLILDNVATLHASILHPSSFSE